MASRSGDPGVWIIVTCVVLILESHVDSSVPERGIKLGHDGGYEGIVVAINNGLDIADRDQFLSALKDLLGRTTDLLFEATEGRVFFSEVTILVPKSWDTSIDTNFTAKLEDAAFRIDRPSPVYGHLPYAQVVRPCGEGGEYIHITPELVMGREADRVGDTARALVHEWGRYRWGLYEEYGRPGDRIHPYFHEDAATAIWLPTGCSSGYYGPLRSELGDECKESPRGAPDDNCRYFPDDRGASSVNSLMYLHNAQSRPSFCKDSTHDRLAPNRQNDLCNHRSCWSVMKDNEDFKNRIPAKEPGPMRLRLAKLSESTKLNILMVLDVTKSEQSPQVWKYLRTELRHMVESLPSGSVVGVATYEGLGKSYRFKELVQLSRSGQVDEMRTLTETIDAIKAGKNSKRDSSRALADSTRMIERATLEEEVLLLFTQFGSNDGNVSESSIIPILQERMARVIGLTFYEQGNAKNMPTLCLKTGGRSFLAKKTTLREDIRRATRFISEGSEVDNRVYQMASGTLTLGPEESNQATFYVEEALGRQSSFSIEHTDGAVTSLIDPVGTMTDVSRDPGCILVNGQFHCQYDSAMPGYWTISVRCEASPCGSETTIGFEAWSRQQSNPKWPTVRFWTGGDGVFDVSREDVLVYAEVHQGYEPLVGLEVSVTVHDTQGPGNPTNLSDDGLDPDISAGDGVYTGIVVPRTTGAILISLNIKGRAKVNAVGTNIGYRWSILPLDQGIGHRGSNSDEESSSGREYVMQRTLVKFTTVKVNGGLGYKARPQRVSDLVVVSAVRRQAAAFVTIQWTSPTSRDGNIKVERYLIFYSLDADSILEMHSSGNGTTLISAENVFPEGGLTPLPAGERHSVILNIPMNDTQRTAYFRIRSINGEGVESELSRVVFAHIVDVKDENMVAPLHSNRTYKVKYLATGAEGLHSDTQGATARPLQNVKPSSSNSSSGDTSSKQESTPLAQKTWFIIVVTVVSLSLGALCAAAIAWGVKTKGRRRQNSMEAMLTWSCLKGGAVLKKAGQDLGKVDQDNRGFDEGVWTCMARGYQSSGNIAALATASNAVEKNNKGERGLEDDWDVVDVGDVVPVDQGPYKEVFIRHPDDITTEL